MKKQEKGFSVEIYKSYKVSISRLWKMRYRQNKSFEDISATKEKVKVVNSELLVAKDPEKD